MIGQGNYWSFNLAGYFLPIVLLNNNVDSGANNVTETYREYVYIYLPGVIGAILALFSVQLPLIGRKWSLVISAALQGVSMAMYTQVKDTAGYVGLNALEYIMQSVCFLFFFRIAKLRLTYHSISMLYFTPPHRRCSTPRIVLARVACYPVLAGLQELLLHLLVRSILPREEREFSGLVQGESGSHHS